MCILRNYGIFYRFYGEISHWSVISTNVEYSAKESVEYSIDAQNAHWWNIKSFNIISGSSWLRLAHRTLLTSRRTSLYIACTRIILHTARPAVRAIRVQQTITRLHALHISCSDCCELFHNPCSLFSNSRIQLHHHVYFTSIVIILYLLLYFHGALSEPSHLIPLAGLQAARRD